MWPWAGGGSRRDELTGRWGGTTALAAQPQSPAGGTSELQRWGLPPLKPVGSILPAFPGSGGVTPGVPGWAAASLQPLPL